LDVNKRLFLVQHFVRRNFPSTKNARGAMLMHPFFGLFSISYLSLSNSFHNTFELLANVSLVGRSSPFEHSKSKPRGLGLCLCEWIPIAAFW
jgi:hypothetical protein